MSKLFGIMITKDDDLIIGPWLNKHSNLFEKIAVVDGSTTDYTKNLTKKFSNIIYCRDPDSHITDQTLRHEGWQHLKPFISLGDWIFLCHPDEFYVHDPRAVLNFLNNSNADLCAWLPLVVLPHPDEASTWIKSKDKDATSIFKHFWWSAGQRPHVEDRMWKYVKEPFWNLEIRTPGCRVIPHNYFEQIVSNIVPIYLHYRCYNLDIASYNQNDGSYKKSTFNQGKSDTDEKHGIGRMIRNFDDFFFHEDHPPIGANQICLEFDENILKILGNPPRVFLDALTNKTRIINNKGEDLENLFKS
jgi:hypothetical protein